METSSVSEQVLEMPLPLVAEQQPPVRTDAAVHISTPDKTISDWLFVAAVAAGFAFLVYINVQNSFFRPLWLEIEAHRWSRLMVRPSILWTSMGALLLIFRTILWFRYRPFTAATLASAPRLTVIIPAYNEGEMVRKSIESVATAIYPRQKLEILVVDDGSTDDTWSHIRRVAARYPGLITAVRLPQNQGKRAALAWGFERAHGELLVTLDSDSVIEPDALLAIAGPFRDPKVGAVAGKVGVFNRRRGIFPRMLHVQYILSFDLLRAVESSYGTVYCCPGALTAYRAEVVHQVRHSWMRQTFLGTPCTYGEDRAMTNLILAAGYDTVYQRSAKVHTVAPENYSKLCKMFLRWDRSYVREEILFMRIVWKRPWGARLLALWDRLTTNLRYPVSYLTLALMVALAMGRPAMVICRVLLAIGLVSLFNMIYYLRSEHSRDFLYGLVYSYFAFFALFWIFPYAVFTVRSRSWLTR